MQSLEAAACEEGEVVSALQSPCGSQCDLKTALKTSGGNSMVCSHSHQRPFKTGKIATRAQPESVSVELEDKLPFSIDAELRELYLEECRTDPNRNNTGLKTNSHLLEKLIAKERLNFLVITLYPGNKGYSMSIPLFPTSPGICSSSSSTNTLNDNTANETVQWLYEEEELRTYIDNEELPAFVINDLKKDFNFLFYSGCIIAEIRDFRQAYPQNKCDIHHVLLRPSMQSILTDVQDMTKSDWSTDECQQLESQLYIVNTPNLCLDPDYSVGSSIVKINSDTNILNTNTLRRSAHKDSKVSVNRKRKLQFTHTPGLELYECGLASTTPTKLPRHTVDLSSLLTPSPVPISLCDHLTPTSSSSTLSQPDVVSQCATALTRPPDTSDFLPQLVETYVLEKGNARVDHSRLSILQRPASGEYLGELYLDRDHRRGEMNGVACRFVLGTRGDANSYIQQFTEVFAESGRKSVTIKYGESGQLKQAQVPMQQNTQMKPLNQQAVSHSHASTKELEISAIAAQLMTDGQQFQAAKQQLARQQQQQKLQQQLQQQQQQTSTSIITTSGNTVGNNNNNNIAIRNILNAPPTGNVNSDAASVAVVNALNNALAAAASNSQTLNQSLNHKLLNRKITLQNARVLNHHQQQQSQQLQIQSNSGNTITGNLIVNNINNRLSLSELSTHLSQAAANAQTITLTSVSGAGNFTNYTSIPIKQQQQTTASLQPQQQQVHINNQRMILSGEVVGAANKSSAALSALLNDTGAADRPNIGIAQNSNSLLLEKFASTNSSSSSNPSPSPTHFIQSPKPVVSPLTSPPTLTIPQSPSPSPSPTPTISMQSLNFAQLTGLQNVQLSGFAQPISLVSTSTTTPVPGGAVVGNSLVGGHHLQHHHHHPTTSLLVSMPVVTSATGAVTGGGNTVINVSSAGGGGGGGSLGVGTTTVVFANVGTGNLAQLVSSGAVKGLTQQTLRTATNPSGTVTLTNQPTSFQLLTPLTASTARNHPLHAKLQPSPSGQAQPRCLQPAIVASSTAATATASNTNNNNPPGMIITGASSSNTISGGIGSGQTTANITTRTLQRTPITIKMATASPNNTNASQMTTNQLAQIQQYQQLYLNQQAKQQPVSPVTVTTTTATEKVRRRSNVSEQQ